MRFAKQQLQYQSTFLVLQYTQLGIVIKYKSSVTVIHLAEVIVRLRTRNGGMKSFNPQEDAAIADRPKAISPLSSIDISKFVFFFAMSGSFRPSSFLTFSGPLGHSKRPILAFACQGGHVSGFLNYRVSRNYPRKCSQLRVITRNYEGSKCTQKFEITMSRYA